MLCRATLMIILDGTIVTVALPAIQQDLGFSAAGLPVHGRYATDLLAALLTFGAGGGLTLPVLATLGMSDATPADAGVLSALFNTTQQVGAAIGVALLSTLAAGRTGQLRQDGLAATAALAAGYRLAFAAAAGLAAAAFIVTATALRPSRAPDQPSASLAIPAECDVS